MSLEMLQRMLHRNLDVKKQITEIKKVKQKNKNLKYLITDTTGKILKNSFDLKSLLKNIKWEKL